MHRSTLKYKFHQLFVVLLVVSIGFIFYCRITALFTITKTNAQVVEFNQQILPPPDFFVPEFDEPDDSIPASSGGGRTRPSLTDPIDEVSIQPGPTEMDELVEDGEEESGVDVFASDEVVPGDTIDILLELPLSELEDDVEVVYEIIQENGVVYRDVVVYSSDDLDDLNPSASLLKQIAASPFLKTGDYELSVQVDNGTENILFSKAFAIVSAYPDIKDDATALTCDPWIEQVGWVLFLISCFGIFATHEKKHYLH